MASIILMFTMFLMEMFSASNSKDSNIVVERWGFMLEKEGIPLGLYSSIDKVSLEIAISKPVVKIPDDVGKAYRVAAETKKRYPNYKAGEEAEICYHMWNVSVVALMSRVDEAESAISDFQELTGDIASLASGESSGRKKRSTLGDLGEIADTVVGYTGSILGLENDSKEADVAAYIRNEVPKIKKGFKKQIKVSGMIVREETEMAEKINELISDVNCRSAAKDYYLLMKDECDTYLSDVKIFTEDYTILGLPESVIDKSMLIRMIRSHPAFNGTIFVKRPSLLRQYSELSTRRVINQNTSLHIFFALTFPILKESDMLPRYSVHQTGISNNGSCHELLLPDTVVLKEDKWYEVRCHGPIKGICPVHEGATTRELSCFSHVSPLCVAPPAKCNDYNYVNSNHGVLVTTSSRVLASRYEASSDKQPFRDNEKLIVQNLTAMNTVYIPWSAYGYVKLLVDSKDRQEFIIRIIRPPISQGSKFSRTINLNKYQHGSYPPEPHLTGLAGIKKENVLLQTLINEEKDIVRNISANPDEFEKSRGTSFDSWFSKIAFGLSLLVTLVMLFKLCQYFSICAQCTLPARPDYRNVAA